MAGRLERVGGHESAVAPGSAKDRAAAADAAATEAEIIRFLANQHRLALEQGDANADGNENDNGHTTHLMLYEDSDFSPAHLTTLYIDPSKLPEYAATNSNDVDDDADRDEHNETGNGVGGVFWYRPTEYADDPDYFKSTSGCGIVREGALSDAWLLGVFAAIALHPDNLIENLFVSDSIHAFKDYGVYTCRFYKNGAWVTVTTDTRVPYALELQDDDRYPSKGSSSPGTLLYGSSLNKNEVFMPFLEKAYAKLHGSYQVLAEANGGATSGKILEAFLDCTGGSAHRIDVHDERLRFGDDAAHSATLWKRMLRCKRKKCIVTAQLKQLSFNAYDMTATGIIKNRQYVVQHVKEVGVSAPASAAAGATGATLRFVKLKTVWGRGMWKGEWSNDDSKWEEHMQVENAMRGDVACEFSRSGTDGCFWMIWDDFLDTFNEIFVVHVLDDMFQYCVQGEWLGHTAAGAPAKPSSAALHASSDSEHAHAGGSAFERPIDRTKWSMLAVAEANWHRNPQFKLTVAERTPGVLISLAQRDFRLFGGDNYAINFVVMKQRESRATVVWECSRSHIVAEAHSYETNDILSSSSSGGAAVNTAPPTTPGSAGTSSQQQPKQLPERELVKEDLVLEPNVAYFVVPYTDNAKVDMEFFLRVFALKPVLVERLPRLFTCTGQGKWRNDDDESGDPTNAGGPLCLALFGGGENAAWCQNPQFWLRLPKLSAKRHAALLAARPYVTIKVVVRKTSHKTSSNAVKARQREAAAKEKGNLVGVTAVRASNPRLALDDDNAATNATSHTTASILRAHAKAPKTNFLGEVVAKPFAKSTTVGGSSAKRTQHDSDAKTSSGGLDDGDGNDDDSRDDLHADAKLSAATTFPSPKLVVKPDEWCRISDYASPAVSCLFLRKVPKEWLLDDHGGGLMLVPTLGEAGAEGTFELQVDSDVPLALDELPTFSTQRLPGEWTDMTAGGCHLHSDWKQNPKVYLHIKGVRPARVTITLTRSELEWTPKCKRDAVGTMLGFYVFHGHNRIARDGSTRIMSHGRPWTETDFVPLHTVHSPRELVLPPPCNEPFVIMPATYDPHKRGTFVVSVQCDVAFSLSYDAE